MHLNKRSIKLVKNLGFKREGLLRQCCFVEFGNYADNVLFSMSRTDWKGRYDFERFSFPLVSLYVIS